METKQLQLVNFKQAKRLKEAGFDWKCHTRYSENNEKTNHWIVNSEPKDHNSLHDHKSFDAFYSAPTVSLALKWFRDVKCQLSELMYTDNGRFYYRIRLSKWSEASTNSFNTYELAESALLDELLTLIEKEK